MIKLESITKEGPYTRDDNQDEQGRNTSCYSIQDDPVPDDRKNIKNTELYG
jgi:hypothetical protein